MPLGNKLYCYVIDGSEGLFKNPTDWLNSLFTINEILVTSVADMVDKIEGRLGKSLLLQNLFIAGHGAPGFQSIGVGAGWDASGAKSLQVDVAAPGQLLGSANGSMRRLAGRFASDGIVTLGGCEVGQDEALLKVLSTTLGGIPVQAGKANQRPLFPGMEGDVVRCKNDTCVNLGGGSWWASPGSWIQ